MKTIKEYLEELPEPERSEALKNQPRLTRAVADSMANAILGAFIWKHTEQGHDYWDKIHKRYNK